MNDTCRLKFVQGTAGGLSTDFKESHNVLDGGAKLPPHDDLVKVGLVLPLRVQEYVQEHLHSVTVIIERTIVELSDKTYPFVIAHRLFV